jgi:hypothetical protein
VLTTDLYERAGCCSPRTLSHLSTLGASLLATNRPLTPRRHSPVVKLYRDPFNRPHSRAVIGIAPNTLLREVFSAKFHCAKALLHTLASPGSISTYRLLRNGSITISGQHLHRRSFARDYGSRLLTLRQYLGFFDTIHLIGVHTAFKRPYFQYLRRRFAKLTIGSTLFVFRCLPLSLAIWNKVQCFVSLAKHFGHVCFTRANNSHIKTGLCNNRHHLIYP